MANVLQDVSQVVTLVPDTLYPQLLTSGVTNGNGVLINDCATNRIAARLHVGAATALTSLTVTYQASPDNVNWTTITGVQNSVITAGNVAPDTVSFQVPEATSATAGAPVYLRAVAAVVGTSVYAVVYFVGFSKIDSGLGYQNSPGVIN